MSDWARLVDQGLVRRNVRLDALTTYKLGGAARWYAEVRSYADLARLGEAWAGVGESDVLVLGKGSNVIVADRGYRGLVIRLVGEFLSIRHHALRIESGAGVGLPRLARSAVGEGRLGLEFMVGIPGTVGGGVYQNAGCHGKEMVDVLEEVEIFDLPAGHLQMMSPAALHLRYRASEVQPSQVVTRAWFGFSRGEQSVGLERMREITRWRRLHQPGGTLNAGSVFKNPPGDAAGRLIDDRGLKGLRVGKVRVSEKHANFFVAERGATSQDVRQLVERVRRLVRDATGIDLEPEIRFVGFSNEGVVV
ncbi:MAG: UDP-N-acetylmuramate dehydrogenase [bacterium]|nr:UDP-N-acetylmuramate dehydrogenase [Acidimicrobiia bacterium]MCY4650599.1 UDP-N-acetylmuramate dehydrogenase [bacterium]